MECCESRVYDIILVLYCYAGICDNICVEFFGIFCFVTYMLSEDASLQILCQTHTNTLFSLLTSISIVHVQMTIFVS